MKRFMTTENNVTKAKSQIFDSADFDSFYQVSQWLDSPNPLVIISLCDRLLFLVLFILWKNLYN